MKFAVTHYVVMIHKPGYGTYTPAFPNLDEAEDFSNAMRLMLETAAISEPVPVVATERVLMPGERAINHMESYKD
jgi:hypothetical protein